MKVFLGGTVSDSTWRKELIPKLRIDYFNPVVDDWNEEAYQRELYEREHCDYNLYVITPKLIGYYSIAEVMDDAMKKSGRTIYCFFREDGSLDFSEAQIVSLEEIGKRAASYGAVWARSLQEIADFLNYAGEHDTAGKTNEQIKLESDYYASFKEVNQAAEQWKDNQEAPDQLWRGTDLNQGLVTWSKLSQKPADHLNDVTLAMQQFVEASISLQESSHKTNLFISYSRNPSTPLARGMYEYLKDTYDVWYDKVSIPHGEDFKISIEKGIRNCDNFIYIISNRAVQSPYCQAELDTAKAYGKRIIPIQQEMDVDNDLIDADIRDINRIFPNKTGEEVWDQEALELQISKVTELDVNLVASHTYFLKRAVAWKVDDYNTRLLMYDSEVEQYEKWVHDLQQQNILTNPVTDFHQAYYTESLAFSKLNYREFWIAGHDKVVEDIVREEFSIGFNPREAAPEGLFKAMNFLYILNEESSQHTPWKDQLTHAREQGMPIYLIDMGTASPDELLKPLPGETMINGADGLDEEEIQELRKGVSITIGKEFRYFKSPGFLTISARHWLNRNQQKADLMRGEMLSYFLYYQQTYPLKLSETTRQYIETSKATTDHGPFDLFICRQKSKLNFAMWLGSQLLNQQLTAWNQHDYQNGDPNERKADLKEGIKNSLNFALVLSHDEGDILEDEWIVAQLEEARRLEKRIFLLTPDLTPQPESLGQYQNINFNSNPEQAAFELINLLTTDQAFIKFFNELYPTALQWKERQDKSARDLLLSGFPLENAENQLKGHEKDVPQTFHEFVRASRKESNIRARRRRNARVAIIVLAIVSFIVGIMAVIQAQKAAAASKDAKEQAEVALAAKEEADQERDNARRERDNAERAELEARREKENAQIAEEKATENAELALLQKRAADAAKQEAQENEERANTLKRKAGRDFRLSRALTLAYETRNTESSLINEGLLANSIQAYYLHLNDRGRKENEADIFTALFRVATSSRYGAKADVIQQFGKQDPLFRPAAIHHSVATGRYYILRKYQTDVMLEVRTPDNTLINQINIKDCPINGGVVSPDDQYYWGFGQNGLIKIDLGTGKASPVGRSKEPAFKVGIASIPRTDAQGRKQMDEYMIALATANKIILYKHQQGRETQLDNPIEREGGMYPFPEAMDIEGTKDSYILTYGQGDSVITVVGRGLNRPNTEKPYILKIPTLENDQISALDQSGFKIAIGTRNGNVSIDNVILDNANGILVTPKSKSRIKKIVLDDFYYAAITYGNQQEKSKLILNTVFNEQQTTNSSGIAHIERTTEDIINDISLSSQNLFYVENNTRINYHTLKSEDLTARLCGLLDNCEVNSDEFHQLYREETAEVKDKLKFCNCNEGE